jgi:hypothetical protein
MRKQRPQPTGDVLARVVLDRYLLVRRGESVTIEAWTHALPWALPFVAEARRLGAEPALVVEDEETFFRSLGARGRRTAAQAPVAPAGSSDVYVYFGGPEDFPRLFGLPSKDLEAVVARHGPGWWQAARRAGLRAARLAISAATPTAAARYGVNLESWQRDILAGSRVTPVRLARRGARWVRRLSQATTVRIRHANGTDLSVRLSPGSKILEDGRVDRADLEAGRFWTQIPTGLVAAPLREGFAEGTWEANRPVYDRLADPPVALGPRFEVSEGRLQQVSFDRGGEPFASAYAAGGAGRDLPSGLSFGLNPAILHAPELEEISLGSVSLLLGNNRAIGGRNRSRFSYLTTLSDATVHLDGVPWLVGGVETAPRRAAAARADRPVPRASHG